MPGMTDHLRSLLDEVTAASLRHEPPSREQSLALLTSDDTSSSMSSLRQAASGASSLETG